MGKKRRRRSSRGSWIKDNGKYLALLLVAAVTVGIVTMALTTPAPPSEARDRGPSLETETPTEEPIVVSVLSDSHAYNADSWWRQTVEAGQVSGVVMGAFESQPGALASSILPRLDAATASGGFVVVQAGTNNLLSAQTPQQAATEIEALWQGVRERGAQPIAALVPPSDAKPSSVTTLNNLLREAAEAQGVPLIDVFSAVDAGDGSWGEGLSDDGVHANKAGSDLMAQAALDQIPTFIRS